MVKTVLRNNAAKGAFFEDVKVGELFTFKKMTYIRLPAGSSHSACEIETGHLRNFLDRQQVKVYGAADIHLA